MQCRLAAEARSPCFRDNRRSTTITLLPISSASQSPVSIGAPCGPTYSLLDRCMPALVALLIICTRQ
ncbi:hypothetical protein EI94DRAFT_1760930 [Lactarius quietus]|nr:hypothetical protein EI94DRAFT_1760930 [Lactarius quietus]